MSLNFDEYAKLFTGGEPAGHFNKKVIVYSEMAVRMILLNFERELTKNLQQADSPDTQYSHKDCFYSGGRGCSNLNLSAKLRR